MAFKTLLTVVSDESDLPVLGAAIAIARTLDAHLEVLCLGVDVTPTLAVVAGPDVAILPELMQEAGTQADTLAGAVQDRLAREEIRWGVEAAASMAPGVSDVVAARARFADLVILSRPLAEGRGPAVEIAAEAALFSAGVPVLIVPPGAAPGSFGTSVVVAWDDGDKAMAAVRAALPLLAGAQAVSVAMVDPKRLALGEAEPGAGLARFLSRHGVEAEVFLLAGTEPKVSETLNRHLLDRNADLLVMGAYGHSRIREMIFGGTTRDMLGHAEVPVLLAR